MKRLKNELDKDKILVGWLVFFSLRIVSWILRQKEEKSSVF